MNKQTMDRRIATCEVALSRLRQGNRLSQEEIEECNRAHSDLFQDLSEKNCTTYNTDFSSEDRIIFYLNAMRMALIRPYDQGGWPIRAGIRKYVLSDLKIHLKSNRDPFIMFCTIFPALIADEFDYALTLYREIDKTDSYFAYATKYFLGTGCKLRNSDNYNNSCGYHRGYTQLLDAVSENAIQYPELFTRRFANPTDIMKATEEILVTFPKETIPGVSLFGIGEKRLDQLVVPQKIAYVETQELRSIASTICKIWLASDDDENLIMLIKAQGMTDNGLFEDISLYKQFHINRQIWEMYSEKVQEVLFSMGFRPEMNSEEWAKVIKAQKDIYPTSSFLNDKFVRLYQLPFELDQIDSVGTSNSFHLMPKFINSALKMNNFMDEGRDVYGLALFYTHHKVFTGRKAELAKRIGEEKVQMVFSPYEIISAYDGYGGGLNHAFLKKNIDVYSTFLGIIGLDGYRAIGFRGIDLSELDEDVQNQFVEKTTKVNATLESKNPDMGLVEDWYLLTDSFMKDNLPAELGY